MKVLRWLSSLVSRRPEAEALPDTVAWKPSSPPSEIDIVLSEIAPDALEAYPPEATDYDVRSLGDPIDPVALHSRHGGRPR